MERIKLLGMTSVLTLLIWAGADSLVNEVASVQVSFDVAPLEDPDMLVALDPQVRSEYYEVRVSGPRRLLEELKEREPLAVRLRIDDRETGSANVTLDKETLKLAMTSAFRDFRKLTVLSVEPKSLPIVVDHLVSIEVPLVLGALSLPYDDPPQLKPTAILAKVRESRLAELRRAGQTPRIDVSAEVERQLRSKIPGESATVVVNLDQRNLGADARLSPASVEVTAVVKAERIAAEIPTVPIRLVVSFPNLANSLHAVAADGTRLTLVTKSIRVTGPTEDVLKLQRGESRAFGFIQIKDSDLQQLGVVKPWTPEFYLPPNITLEAPAAPVEFKLVAATTTQAGSPN